MTDGIEGRGPWQLAWGRLRRDKVAIASMAVIVLVALFAVIAPVIARAASHPPNTQYTTVGLTAAGLPRAPSGAFWFGTDDLGRDIFVRVVYGARVSLAAGVCAGVVATAIGAVVGLASGYLGGWTDTFLARLMDTVLSIPFLVFAIALVAIAGPSLAVSIGVITFFSWSVVGRVVRGETLSIKEKEYIEAARSLGASPLRVMFVDILPGVTAPLIVYSTLLIPASIAFEATLSFLGLGVVPPTPSWGGMLAEGIHYYRQAWWFVIFPGAALVITTLAFNFLGDSVRDALDPRGERLFRS